MRRVVLPLFNKGPSPRVVCLIPETFADRLRCWRLWLAGRGEWCNHQFYWVRMLVLWKVTDAD